jgi:hypothetical protein
MAMGRNAWRTALVLMAGGWMGCAAGGGGTPQPDDTTDFQGDLSQLMADDEAWLIGSDAFLLGGYGSEVEFAILTADPESPDRCLGIDPSGGFRFEDGTLTADVAYADIGANRNCRLQFTADASDCAPGDESACDATSGSGQVQVGTRSTAITAPQIARLTPCTPPASLDETKDWTVQNMHLVPRQFLADAADIGATVSLGGNATGELLATIATGVGTDGTAEGCFDQSPEGVITFDGTTLVIDVVMEGTDNESGLGQPGPCSIEFEGTVTYCAEYDPESLGGNATDSAGVIRIDGTGSYEFNNVGRTLQIMYLTVLLAGPDDVRR